MPLSLYELTIPLFIHELKILSSILSKGHAHAGSNEQPLLDGRLAEDMNALPFQIQQSCGLALFTAVRLANFEPAVMEDDEKSFAELQERMAKTIELLEKIDPESLDAMEEGEVVVQDHKYTGKSFVTEFALPNFFFHVCTAYAILRMHGVPLGKGDYLGWS